MKVWLAAILAIMPTAAIAQLRPIAGPGDARMQTVIWHPDEVVRLTVAPQSQLVLILSANERVQSVALGDSGAWQVTVSKSADTLFVKPLRADAVSNMTVMTDTRIYTFDLVAEDSTWSAYVVHFLYPTEQRGLQGLKPVIGANAIERYKVHGAKALRPALIADDGDKTWIRWGEAQAIPAVFAVDDTGKEFTVDGYMRNDAYTIDRVYPKLVFRIDRTSAVATRAPQRTAP